MSVTRSRMKKRPYLMALKMMSTEELFLINCKVVLQKTDSDIAVMSNKNPRTVADQLKRALLKFKRYYNYFEKCPSFDAPELLLKKFPPEYVKYVHIRFHGHEGDILTRIRRKTRKKLGTKRMHKLNDRLLTTVGLEEYVELLNLKNLDAKK